MRIIANCCDMKLEIPVGSGKQHVRWLGLVVAIRMQREKYPHAFRVPQCVTHDGNKLMPRDALCKVLNDGDEVTVELRQGAAIPEEGDFDTRQEWMDESYGEKANLMDCKFRWKGEGGSIPQFVRGDYYVAQKWQGVYPQKDFGGRFEAEIQPIEEPGGQIDWVATRKGPPGMCNFKFVMSKDGVETETTCAASPETLTRDKSAHHVEFHWDVPIAPEPYPEVDSRPSTASSRDGAQVDPRFEEDWGAMRLKWVDTYMKVRVKDVLTEFYAILIDLFDSYAFMGLDLTASEHTIGMDDWKHLVINCNMLQGQREPGLQWWEVGAWLEDAVGVKDCRPYLAQRLTRAHYLELLMRTASWTMCEHPVDKYAPEQNKPAMPLDEGLFRFVTDILIPVMDTYDDDPIRKDAVIHQNLAVIQQNRPSIRSIYAFLAQPWSYCDNEKVVVPNTFRWVLDFAHERLSEAERGAPAGDGGDGDAKSNDVDISAVLGGGDKLNVEQLELLVGVFDGVTAQITSRHPEEADQRAFLFWEFFEMIMELCRQITASVGTPLHEVIPALVQTILAVMRLVDEGVGGAALPEPPVLDAPPAEAEAAPAEA